MAHAHPPNRKTFDLCIEVAPTSRERRSPRPGATYMVHVKNRSTPAGAIATAGTYLSFSEKKRVYSRR